MKSASPERFRELLNTFDTAVLVTHCAQTGLRGRPMAIARVDDNCDLWFITQEDSAKVHEIERDTRVQVICQNGWSSCISLTGRASLDHDAIRIAEMWKPSYQVWFPKGATDPSIVLIKVTGEQAEFWDNTGTNEFTYLYRAMKALATGTTPEITEGEQHGRVTLRRAS